MAAIIVAAIRLWRTPCLGAEVAIDGQIVRRAERIDDVKAAELAVIVILPIRVRFAIDDTIAIVARNVGVVDALII